MELTKNTSVDPAKMIGMALRQASMQNFQNTILDEKCPNTQSVTLTG